MVNFDEKVKTLRMEHKLPQHQLVSQIGIAVSVISSYESGNRSPSYEVLISFARILHVSTDYLLGLDKHKTFAKKQEVMLYYIGKYKRITILL